MPRIAHPHFVGPGLLAAAITLSWASTAHGISPRTLLTPTGAGANDVFGVSVASAGDVNGDGFPDLIVGANGNDTGGIEAGRAYVYYGGPVADATADLTLTGAAALDNFGFSVASAGDVNGDGFADLIVGAYGSDAGGSDAGRAYVYYGGPTADATADLTLTGAAAGDFFGLTVASAGDFNGDGFADLIVGASGNDAGGVLAGRAYVYYGGPAIDAVADLTLTGAAAADEFGQSVASAGDVNGDGFSDVIVGAYGNDLGGPEAGRASVYYGGPAADAIADLTLTGAAASDFFGYSVASAGDVNGDGFADLIVGAYLNDAGGGNAGRAYVYYGGAAANSVADLTLTGAAFDEFGHSVASAGDVNGDGFADVIVGARQNDSGGNDAGRAYVYYGGPAADATADIILTGVTANDFFGYSVASAGDFDSDGFADVIVGAFLSDAGAFNSGRAYVVTSRPYEVLNPDGGEQWVAGQPATVRWLGHDVADLAVSFDGGASWNTMVTGVGGGEDNSFALTAPGPATSLAKVRVSASGVAVSFATSDVSDGVFNVVLPSDPPAAAHRLQLTPTGAAAGDQLGWSVASAGDVNGDGFADLIVGALANDAGGPNAGRAHVYYGGPAADAIADLTLTGSAPDDQFGISVASAGDVNGDGFADLIVGAHRNDAGGPDAGRAYVYYGGPAADGIADLILTGAAASDFFGASVASAGDVNGDGSADVIVGAWQNDAGGANAGRAYVYYGGSAADATADLTVTGDAAGDFLGWSVASAGDVNGDGFADLIVGAFVSDAGGTKAGRAYVYHGGPAADDTADLTLTGAAAGDHFGTSVASAGDVNGDGFADLIVGADGNDAAASNAGRAYVYHGGPAADAAADLTLTGASTFDFFGYSVASAGDVNADGFADLVVGAYLNDGGGSDAGRANVYYGGRAADDATDLTRTVAVAFSSFGFSVASAGDVNGDGFDDLIVGATLNDAGGSNAGRAYLFDCNRYFLLSPNDDEVWNVGASQSVSWLGAERADLWLSTDGGNLYELLRQDVGGSETNAIALLHRMPRRSSRESK